MPAEPHIAQLLEAYRQKRRAAAGEPLAPHPATRQLLQGEVARTYGTFQPGPTPVRGSWLAAFWPRLALGGSAFALVAFVLFQMQHGPPPSLTETDSDTQAAGERSVARSSAPGGKRDFLGDAPAPTPDSPLARSRQLAKGGDAESAGRSATATAAVETQPKPAPVASELADLKRAEMLALQPASPPANPAGGAGRVSGTLELGAFRDAADRSGEKDAKAEPQLAAKKLPLSGPLAPATPAPLAINTPRPTAAPPVVAAGAGSREIQSPSQAGAAPALAKAKNVFKNDAPALDAERAAMKAPTAYYFLPAGLETAQAYRYVNPRPDLRQNFNSPAAPEVLVQFQVAVTGDQVRFTDADGSTYEGRLLPADEGKLAAKDAADAPAPERAKLVKEFGNAKDADEELERKAKATPTLAATKQDGDKLNRSDTRALGEGRGTLSFAVSGTNRRLNQHVEFRGQFLPAPPEESGLPQLREDAEQLQASQTVNSARRSAGAKQLPTLPVASSGRQTQSLADNFTTAATQQNFPMPVALKPAAAASQLNPTAPAPSPDPAPRNEAAPAAPASPGLTIRGWVVVGGSNQFEIRAVPTPRR